MDTAFKQHSTKLYSTSFMAVVALLPWSLTLTSYALVLLVVSGLASTSFTEKKLLAAKHPKAIVFYILFLLYVVGLFYTKNLTEGFKSIEQKLVLLLLPFIITTSAPLESSHRNSILKIFVLSVLFFTLTTFSYTIFLLINGTDIYQINFDLLTLAQFEKLHPPDTSWMKFSYIAFTHGLIGPTYLSIYVTLSILIIYYSKAHSSLQRFLKVVAILWLSVVVVLLSSRMGVFIYIIAVSLNLIYDLSQRKYAFSSISIIILTFLGVLTIVVIISPVTRFRLIEEPLTTPFQLPDNSSEWNSINLRYLQWQSGYEVIKENTLSGTGTGGALGALKEKFDQTDLGLFAGNYNSHNQYIETFLEIGLTGFIALLLCLVIPLTNAIYYRDPLLFSVILITSLACLSTCVFEKQKGLVFYMAFTSLLLFSGNKTRKL